MEKRSVSKVVGRTCTLSPRMYAHTHENNSQTQKHGMIMRPARRALSLCARATAYATAEAPAVRKPAWTALRGALVAGGFVRFASPIGGAKLPLALAGAQRPFARSFASSAGSDEDDGSDDDLYNFIEYPPAEAVVGQTAPGFKCDGE
jgi:hypothetical protein